MRKLESTAVALLLVMLTAMLLAGCGQSGPLYLPGNPSQVQAPPAEIEDEEDEDDEEDEAEQR